MFTGTRKWHNQTKCSRQYTSSDTFFQKCSFKFILCTSQDHSFFSIFPTVEYRVFCTHLIFIQTRSFYLKKTKGLDLISTSENFMAHLKHRQSLHFHANLHNIFIKLSCKLSCKLSSNYHKFLENYHKFLWVKIVCKNNSRPIWKPTYVVYAWLAWLNKFVSK